MPIYSCASCVSNVVSIARLPFVNVQERWHLVTLYACPYIRTKLVLSPAESPFLVNQHPHQVRRELMGLNIALSAASVRVLCTVTLDGMCKQVGAEA
jgi:hypothetical protein